MRLIYSADCTRVRIEGRVALDVFDSIDTALTYSEPGAFHTPQFKRRVWDGKVRLLRRKDQSFPAGLMDRVRLTLQRKHDLDPDIIDERPPLPWGDEPPEVIRTLGGGATLYDDQAVALEAFVDVGRGCLQLPTSAGKTEIAASLFKMLHPHRCLMIVDRKALLVQTRDRLETRLGERVGMLGAQRRETNRRVTVATIQSLWAHWDRFRHEFFPEIKCVVVDEAHGISKNMWFETLEVIPAPVRLGLSATIKESSRRMVVESYLGPLLFEQTLEELVESGRAATPHVSLLRMREPDLNERDAAGTPIYDPTYAYWHGVVTSGPRNRAAVLAMKRAVERGLPVLTLVVRIEHGRSLQRLCEMQGLDIPFIYGQTDPDEIQRAKNNLEGGRIPGLIASTIFDKGIDVPNVRAMVLAGGQRSALLVTQRLGRGVRKKLDGPNEVHVLDFYDQTHGTLRSQANDRWRTYKKKKIETRIIESLDEWLP